ncbi:cell wall hydrolase [Paracoccaceae bacterium]|nr:cell wall hydrolase [Paracoccaceae bacterium]
MKPLVLKKMTILLTVFIHLVLTSHTVFPQTSSIVKKEGNLKLEQLIVSLRTTVEEGMIRLNNIDDNYLTKISGLINYDRAYLSKASEKHFFSKGALDSLRMPKMNRELKCLSEALYFEARGEQIEGQIAVADVIINRKNSNRFPSTICGVVSEGAHKKHACQFSYNCDGKLELIYDKKTYRRIVKLSSMILNGAFSDVTNGATFFHASEVSPSWSKKFKKTRKIGRHLFYKN